MLSVIESACATNHWMSPLASGWLKKSAIDRMEGNIGGHMDLDIEITGFTRDRPAGEIIRFIRHIVC